MTSAFESAQAGAGPASHGVARPAPISATDQQRKACEEVSGGDIPMGKDFDDWLGLFQRLNVFAACCITEDGFATDSYWTVRAICRLTSLPTSRHVTLQFILDCFGTEEPHESNVEYILSLQCLSNCSNWGHAGRARHDLGTDVHEVITRLAKMTRHCQVHT